MIPARRKVKKRERLGASKKKNVSLVLRRFRSIVEIGTNGLFPRTLHVTSDQLNKSHKNQVICIRLVCKEQLLENITSGSKSSKSFINGHSTKLVEFAFDTALHGQCSPVSVT